MVLILEAGILALAGLLVGAFRATGFLGGTPEPLEAAARIFFLVSADGRLSWDVVFLAGDAGTALVALEARTVALTRPVVLTVGSLTLVLALAVVFVVLFP